MLSETKSRKKKVLFVYSPWTTFTKVDYDILSTRHELVKYQFVPKKGLLKVGLQFLRQLIYLLTRIWSFDAIYIWFADYHSFLPILFAKILGKKSYVVIGGYDVANFPDLHYGTLTSPLRKTLTLYSLKHATLCIPVVEELEKKLKEICPEAKTKTIHTGYTFKKDEKFDLSTPREKVILTVSITENHQRYMIKGLDRFKELAALLPDYKFYIIGINEDAKKLFEPIPSNLFFYPPLKQSELTAFYLQSCYYAQFSRSEGLPNALCEAMLYGCVPLGIKVGGIGTAIENYGFLLEDWNPSEMKEFIRNDQLLVNRNDISNHIMHKFDIAHRIDKLLKTVSA